MQTPRLDRVRLPQRPPNLAASRLWREWCFLRAAARRFRGRLLLLFMLLCGGGLLFKFLEPECNHSYAQAVYCTWSLIFGEPPEAFPRSAVLQVLFFVLPVVGLVVIIEAIVDFAFLIRDRRRNERSWCNIMATALSNHIILIGLGKLGYRTFLLLRRLGEAVVVIEQHADNQFLDVVRRDGSPLFVGDARREALLDEANVANAKTIILATNDDLANLEAALDARQRNPNIHVVMRMFDQNMADKIRQGFGIQAAMSQSAISAPAFVTAALERSIVSSLVLDDELVVMQRWNVLRGGPLCDKTIADVMATYGVSVVRRRPAGGPPQLIPSSDTHLVDGDELLVQGTFDVLTRLREQMAHATAAGA